MGACMGKGGEGNAQRNGGATSVKLVIIGQANVGKTSLLARFADDVYPPSASTVEMEFKRKMLTTDKGKDVNLNVFDTAGQEKYRTITSSFYTNCKGVMVMFDLSDAASFDALENWFNESSRYAEKATQFLIGNKSDVSERTVTPERIQQVVSKYGVTYFETSAATGAGVFEAFKAIAQQLVDDEDDLLGGEAPPTD